jgi:hypothetical protein
MPKRNPAAGDPVLGRRALNRAYLARQMLLERVELPIETAIERLVAMQAQNPFDPYTALWSRLQGFRAEALSDLIETRRVVRATAMLRTTIHLLTARDWLAIRPVLQVVQERGFWTGSPFGRQIRGVPLEEVLAAGRALLDEKPRPANTLGKLLHEQWPDADATSLGYAVRYLVPLVQTTPRGLWGRSGGPVLATAEHWLGQSVGTDDAPDELILRYLAVFGPATVMDIQAWSWLTKLAAVVERLRPRLRTFRDEAGRELFDIPDGPLPDPDTPAPVRFLPTYDNLLLSHKDRSRIVGDGFGWGNADRFLERFNGGSFLVDGFLAGGWRLERDGKPAVVMGGAVGSGTARIVVMPARPLSSRDRDEVAAEAERLLAFLGSALPPSARSVQFEAENR